MPDWQSSNHARIRVESAVLSPPEEFCLAAENRQLGNIDDRHEQHQRQNDGHAGAEREFLTAGTGWFAADCFHCIKSQVPTVEGRDWQQVNERQVKRDERGEADEFQPPEAKLLT